MNDLVNKNAHQHNPACTCLVMAFGAKGVGDHLVCSSFIRNLAKSLPGCTIDFGVYSQVGAELFKHNPHIKSIQLLDMDYVKLGGKYRFRDKLRYLASFRRRRYDRVYILGSKFRHALFAFLTGSPVRIGNKNSRRGFLLTRTISEPLEKNIVERFLDLLRIDGLSVDDPYLELFLSEQEVKAAEQCLAAHGIVEGDRILAIAPFAADKRRTWALDRFWEIARRFSSKRNYKVVVLGGMSDRGQIDRYPEIANGSVINLVGKLPILETAAIIKKSNLFLSNDSGLAHIAGAVGTKTLVLGYHITRWWYPLAKSVELIIKDTGCRSCKVDTCELHVGESMECFDAIQVKEVEGKLEEMDAHGGEVSKKRR